MTSGEEALPRIPSAVTPGKRKRDPGPIGFQSDSESTSPRANAQPVIPVSAQPKTGIQ